VDSIAKCRSNGITGVTVGIPVFNEEGRIESAIRSVVSQCERLIIADNASTDKTGIICKELMSEFSNIEYQRHGQNIGSFENIKWIADRVITPYFMLLGGHDAVGKNFICQLKNTLLSDSSVQAAAGGLFYDYEGRESEGPIEDQVFNSWDSGMHDDARYRVRALLFHDDTRLAWATYGLYRTDTFRKFFTETLPVYALDLVFLAMVLSSGKLAIVKPAHYYAWIRSAQDTEQQYVDRLFGNKKNKNEKKLMKLTTRRELFNVLEALEKPASLAKVVSLRYRFMCRKGLFKTSQFDFLYYSLVIPVLVASELSRITRRFGITNTVIRAGGDERCIKQR
jgi:glycosyltransferase involved in cell wall biosynthesis